LIPLRDRPGRSRLPIVTLGLIAANVIAYLLSIRGGGSIIDGPTHMTIVADGAIPYELAHLGSHCALGAAGFSQTVLCTGQAGVTGTVPTQPATWQTAFSSMFLHANALSIFIDGAFLAVFGATLEDTLGRLRFLVFYLLGGLAALALTVAAAPDSVNPQLGAAGAVAAVIGAYVLLRPRTGVLAVMLVPFAGRTAELPAWVLLGAWLTLELALGAPGVLTRTGGWQVVYQQLGGIAFGVLAARAFSHGRPVALAQPGPA
jgi:membrane associated rhomboid family serine protease